MLSYFHGPDPSTGHRSLSSVWKIGLLRGTPWLQFTPPIHPVWPHQHLITFLNLGFDYITHVFSKPSNISLRYSKQCMSCTWNFSNRCHTLVSQPFNPSCVIFHWECNCTNGLLNTLSAFWPPWLSLCPLQYPDYSFIIAIKILPIIQNLTQYICHLHHLHCDEAFLLLLVISLPSDKATGYGCTWYRPRRSIPHLSRGHTLYNYKQWSCLWSLIAFAL